MGVVFYCGKFSPLNFFEFIEGIDFSIVGTPDSVGKKGLNKGLFHEFFRFILWVKEKTVSIAR